MSQLHIFANVDPRITAIRADPDLAIGADCSIGQMSNEQLIDKLDKLPSLTSAASALIWARDSAQDLATV